MKCDCHLLMAEYFTGNLFLKPWFPPTKWVQRTLRFTYTWNVENWAIFCKWNKQCPGQVNKFCQNLDEWGSNAEKNLAMIGNHSYGNHSFSRFYPARIQNHFPSEESIQRIYSFPCNTLLKFTNTTYFQFEQVKPVVFEDEDLRTNIATNQSWSSIHVHPQGENSWLAISGALSYLGILDN